MPSRLHPAFNLLQKPGTTEGFANWIRKGGVLALAFLLALALARPDVSRAQSLTLDLRLSDGGNAKARTVAVGDVLTLQLYGTVTGLDGLNNEGLQFVWGSILGTGSSGTAVGGNLSTTSLTAPFNAAGSQTGAVVDLNSDGFADVGSNSTAQNTNFIQARSGTMTTNGTRIGTDQEEFLLGTLTYTVTQANVNTTSTDVNFRITDFTPVNERIALFQADGANKNELNATINTGAAITFSTGPATAYWHGDQSTSWATDNLGNTNFATDVTGGTDTGTLPGDGTDVFFNTTGATNLSTTLDRDFSIKSLTFTSNATAPVTISPGTGGNGANNLLTIGDGGVTVQNGSGAHSIVSRVRLGGANAQHVWSIGAAGPLTVSGEISGAGKGITKNGVGVLALTGNNTFTGATIINAGTLRAGAAGALGATSSVRVNSGGTLALTGAGNLNRVNNSAMITLAGGTLNRGQGASEGTASSIGLGTLRLEANSIVDFGDYGLADVGTLTFADFDPQTFTLTIENWTAPEFAADPQNYAPSSLTDDRLIFNTDQTANLAAFQFSGYTGARQIALGGGFFEIVPDALLVAIPEASTVYGCLALLGFVGWRHRRGMRMLSRKYFSRLAKEF